MQFIKQANKGRGNFGTYMLTISIVIISLILGQVIADGLSVKFLHYHVYEFHKAADSNVILSLLLLPFGFVLAALILSIKYLHRQPVISIFTIRENFDWKRFFTSFGSWGTIMGAFLLLGIVSGEPIEWNFNPHTFINLLLISLFLIPLQTTAEEVLFRGYLFQGFGKVFKKGWIAVLITSILFGLLHGANPEVTKLGYVVLIYYIGTGIFLSIMTHMDNGIELAMGYHAINNIFAALIITNDWQAFQTDALFIDRSEPSFGTESLLTIFLLQPALLFLFSRLYKWKNWKNKLFD